MRLRANLFSLVLVRMTHITRKSTHTWSKDDTEEVVNATEEDNFQRAQPGGSMTEPPDPTESVILHCVSGATISKLKHGTQLKYPNQGRIYIRVISGRWKNHALSVNSNLLTCCTVG